MKMDGEESWIDVEIERELSRLPDQEDASNDLDHALNDTVDDSLELDDVDDCLKKYEERQNNVIDNIKHQLDDVDSILVQTVQNSKNWDDIDDEVRKAAQSRGVDVKVFSQDILNRLAEEDEEDGKDSNEESGNECTSEEVDKASESTTELSGESGALVEYSESNELERKLHEQMKQWLRDQKVKDDQRTVENEQNYSRIRERLDALETQRHKLMEAMNAEKSSLEKAQTLKQAEIEIECAENLEVLKQEEERYSFALKALEEEKNKQESYVQDLKAQAEFIDSEKKNKAATRIQSLWRGHQVRAEYGETVEEWVQHGRKKREEERIREIENDRIRLETAERKRIEEEQREKRLKEMERLKEEERMRKEEKERLRKLEEEKIDAEKKRKRDEEREKYLEEERKRMVEEERKAKADMRREQEKREREEMERKKAEEQQAKEMEEQRLAEERRNEELEREEELKRKQEEEEAEQRRIKEEKLEKEQDQARLAEERRREELRRVEELKRIEENREREEERKRKEAEDARLKEEQRKAEIERVRKLEEEKRLAEIAKIEAEKKEMEKRKLEEKRRRDEESKRLDDERKLEELAKEEMKKKLGIVSEESKSESMNGNNSARNCRVDIVTEEEPPYSELLQKGRLAWMQCCIPLSKLMMESKSRKLMPSVVPKRRPSSSKKLSALPDEYIFTDGLSDSYDEIIHVSLKDLPAYSLQSLSMCSQLTRVDIQKCQIMVLDAFEKCQNLQMLKCTGSKVEVISMKNLKELILLDLSDNQISSIHGLDGCTSLRFLNLHKNRITKIDNLCHLTNLHTLILSQNSISRTNNLGECPTIQILNISGNNIRKAVEVEKLPLLRDLNLSHNSLDSIPILSNNVLLESLKLEKNGLCDITALGVFWLPMLTDLNLSNNSLRSLPPLNYTMNLKSLNLSENNLGDVSDFLSSLINCEQVTSLSLAGNPVCDLVRNLRDLVKTGLPWLSCIDGYQIDAKPCHKLDTEFHQLCASQRDVRTKLCESFDLKLGEISSKEPELLPEVHKLFYDKSHKMAADFRYNHEYGDLKMDSFANDFFDFKLQSLSLRCETPAVQKSPASSNLNTLSQTNVVDAKSKFEMALGPKTGSSTGSKAKCETVSKRQTIKDPQLMKREKSAVKIQSLWRGFLCRKRLALAYDFARNMDSDLGNFDEIDIDAFDFDAGVLDEEWLPPDEPQLLNKSPVLRPISTDRPGVPMEAWQNLTSKPPISPAPPSDIDTQRTKASKTEQLTEEWGFKDTKTADLMLKRARKLKYDALRRKKMSGLDPKQRLLMMRKLEESSHLPSVQAAKKPPVQRKDYFRAKQEWEEHERLEKVNEGQNKMHRMYEWLHTAAGVGACQDTQRTASTTTSQKPPLRKDWFGSEGSLHKVELARFQRSPGSDHMSLQSVESDRSGRRFSYEGVSSRKVLPPIKNNSAPTAQRPSAAELGWGGGKKRGKRLS